MRGSVDITTGKTLYEIFRTGFSQAFSGFDAVNSGDAIADWYSAQANSLGNFRADTTLATSEWERFTSNNYYGDFASRCTLGGYVRFTIPEAWKTDCTDFYLRVKARSSIQHLNTITFARTGSWLSSGTLRFRISENPNLFTSGSDLEANFGTGDFTLSMAALNAYQQANGKTPVTAYNLPAEYLVGIPYAQIQAMSGDSLYLWWYYPYATATYTVYPNTTTWFENSGTFLYMRAYY